MIVDFDFGSASGAAPTEYPIAKPDDEALRKLVEIEFQRSDEPPESANT
jgi:hypothetical protein